MAVETATTAPEALALLSRDHALLVSALDLPEHNGLKLMREIDKRADLMGCKRILVSPETHFAGSDLRLFGVHACLAPTQNEALQDAVFSALSEPPHA